MTGASKVRVAVVRTLIITAFLGALPVASASAAVQGLVVSKTESRSCVAPPADTAFLFTDTVYIWFVVPAANGGDLAVAKWFHPNGSEALVSTWPAVPSAGTWCFFANLAFSSGPSPIGPWRVEIYINGQLEMEIRFDVSAPSPSPGAGTGSYVLYYGLGDSVASGHGLGGDADDCRRSSAAYPRQVRSQFERMNSRVRLFDQGPFACSGARSGGVADADLPAQITAALNNLLDARQFDPGAAALASITVGANDLGWSDPIQFSTFMCGNDTTYENQKKLLFSAISTNVKAAIERLVQANVAVIVTGYHNPTNPTSTILTLLGCALLKKQLTKLYDRTEDLVATLESVLSDVVARTGSRVRFVPMHREFRRHYSAPGFCGSTKPPAGTWIQEPKVGPSWVDFFECFHPNITGTERYAFFLASAVAQLVP